MPYYKDIYYADGSTNLSVADISYAEAVSTGDKLEQLKLDAPVVVSSDAERSTIFPTPAQGDAVWRTDYGFEQRYFDAYSSSNPGGKTPAGWYAISRTLKQVVPANTNGSDGTVTNNGSGLIQFTGSTSVYLGNIFSSVYTKYRVIINAQTISSAAKVYGYFSTSGVINSSSLYAGTYFGASASNTTGLSGTVYPNTGIIISTYESSQSEETIVDFYFNESDMKLYPSYQFKTGSSKAGSNYTYAGYFNSSTTLFDGFAFGTNSSNKMTGTVRVYGYN